VKTKGNKKTKGIVFVTVIVISMLMIFMAVGASNMLLQDAHMVKRLKRSVQAQYLAEAGISDALATLATIGFAAKDNPANFPQRILGNGTYDVTVIESGGRVLLSSVGTAEGVSRTVSAEVEDVTPTSLYYMLSSGSDLWLFAILDVTDDIDGDIHSNLDMTLWALWGGDIDIDACTGGCCDGSVSAGGTVDIWEGGWWGGNVTIHGSTTDGAAAVTFPNFNYAYYENLAIAGGDYHNGDQIWDGVNLNPTNGIVYVDGTVEFRNECHITGGIVADSITVNGELYQHKDTAHNRNVIISRTGNMFIVRELTVEEALIYSANDFIVVNVAATLDITGILISAARLLVIDVLVDVEYDHHMFIPEGLIVDMSGGAPIKVTSWNR